MPCYSLCLNCGNWLDDTEVAYCKFCDTPQKRTEQKAAQATLEADRQTDTDS